MRIILELSAAFLLVAVALALVLTIVADSFSRRLGTQIAEERAGRESSRIWAVLDKETTLAERLAGSPSLKRWLGDESDPVLYREAMESLETSSAQFLGHDWFVAVDSSRRYYNKEAGRLKTTILSRTSPADSWYLRSANNSRPYELNLDYDVLTAQTALWINCPVREGSRVLGVVGTGIPLAEVLNTLVKTRADTQVLLVDAKGTVTADANQAVLETNGQAAVTGRRVTLEDLVSNPKDAQRLKLALATATETNPSVTSVVLEGSPRLVAVLSVPEIGWKAVVAINRSSLLDITAFLPFQVAAVAALVLLLVWIGLRMERLVLQPVLALTASTRRIAEGHYEENVAVEGIGEMADLASTFGWMATEVREHTVRLETAVLERTTKLRELNLRLTQSLDYASLIQGRLAPSPALWEEIFADHALFLRERDGVGGDFLYAAQTPGGVVFGVADCTGHGVSGALTAMLVKSALDQIISRVPSGDPAVILTELDAFWAKLWKNADETGVHGGLDLALCRLSPDRRELVYAGAGLPLWVIEDEGVSLVQGRRKSLAPRYRSDAGPFELWKGSARAFALVTDGFFDQIGPTSPLPFGKTRLQAALAGSQKPDWHRAFDSWRAEVPQRDDVLAFWFTLFDSNSGGK